MGYDSSRVEVLGPFDIAWNTTGIAAGFVAVSDDLPVGTDVIKAWAVFSAQWNSVTSDTLALGVSSSSVLATAVTVVTYDAKAATVPTTNAQVEALNATSSRGASVLTTSVISAKVTSVGGSLSAGAAKVFALVVHPASDE